MRLIGEYLGDMYNASGVGLAALKRLNPFVYLSLILSPSAEMMKQLTEAEQKSFLNGFKRVLFNAWRIEERPDEEWF